MSLVCVGNDVVDLESLRTQGRSVDQRFVGRVLDEDERAVLHGAEDPDLELWCRWAAKEAGFKVISKLMGVPPPFVHRAFKVHWTGAPDADRTRPTAAAAATDHATEAPVIRRGRVSWQGRVADVSVALHAGAVHAVACGLEPRPAPGRVEPRVALLDQPRSPWAGELEHLMTRFTEREADAVYSRPSAAVRIAARAHLAGLIGVSESRLEIVCAPGPTSQRPPHVLLDGERTEADVSLSHDGRLIAWAIWVGGHTDYPRAKDAS